MKILVTGASGQLGRELEHVFQDQGKYEVAYFYHRDMPLEVPDKIHESLRKVLPDIIIHAGAYTAVDRAEEEPELVDKVNHLSTAEIARYCVESKCRLIFISTDYVFGGNTPFPLLEEEPASPINVYGLSKWRAEESINRILGSAIIIRTSWVYSRFGNNFVKTMIRLMRERSRISVVDDQVGSPTNAGDLALAISAIVNHSEWLPGTYHYSNEGQTTWFNFAKEIKKICQFQCEVIPTSSSEFNAVAVRPKYSRLKKDKIKKTFGIDIPEWKDSLQKMLSSYRPL